MSAYMIVDVEVKDLSAYERYKAEVPALIRKHGGECLVRGGGFEVVEGEWQPSRLVLFRFPDKESVKAFFNDPEYLPLKQLRHSVADTDIVVVEGL
jgi:uncharacterized protein (DUF1330 family)